MRWFMDLAYPLMDRTRPRAAARAARNPVGARDFSSLRGARQALVVTFKRSGEPVATPVNVGLSSAGALYFRSEPTSAKIRRIRHDARVLVGPSSFRGKPSGPLAAGTARILEPAETQPAELLVQGNWSRAMRPLERALDRLGVPEVYVEVTPTGSQAEAQAAR